MSKLIVLSAPSGAGKTTLCKMLLDRNPQLRLSISSTTRLPRGTEKHGVDYFFLTKEAFELDIQKSFFAEWARVHDYYYGTSKAFIDTTFQSGKSVLLDIDVQGAESLRQAYPKETFSIFISPPSLKVLEDRLRSRGTDSEAVITKRLQNAQKEMAQIARFDLTLVNDDLHATYQALEKAVRDVLNG